MIIYVNSTAPLSGDGSREHPFRTIQAAAERALPGDEVLVAPGTYREHVSPIRAGLENARITYRSEVPLAAVITGAEEIHDWTRCEGNVWVTRIPNTVFRGKNPYTTPVGGDWFNATFKAHTGEVFLNDKALYEVDSLAGCLQPEVYPLTWYPEDSLYTWYTEQDEASDETVIYANFQAFDPTKENVEITVRDKCFYPGEEHVNYITLSGFTVTKAASQWAPPTALQEAMIGPHWSKGWVIEDCDISNAKCSGISLGKYYQPGNDNKWTHTKTKDGAQTQRDCVMRAMIDGWSKETIGSHIIRRCEIHDCGQTGIVGHMGCINSLIEDNHIHHVNVRQNLAGAEIGGIKMHAAIDTVIRHNHFDHCTRGIWLDWEAQGTRVTGNIFHDNCLPNSDTVLAEGTTIGEDLFIEISHGPTLVDNNIMLSDMALKLPTQGCAFVHNLFAGSITAVDHGVKNGSISIDSTRYTPYHEQHGTNVTGFMSILHGDMRFYNNIFVQRPVRPEMQAAEDALKVTPNEWTDNNTVVGTVPYEDFPTYEEWIHWFDGYCGQGAAPSNRYYDHLPVWTGGNVYLNGAQHISKEENYAVGDEHVEIALSENDGVYQLVTDLYEHLPEIKCSLIATETLGKAFEPEQQFENADGSPIVFDTDILGNKRSYSPLPGPFACGCEAGKELF